MSEKFENDLSIYALVIINYVRINRLETLHILFNINIGSLSMLIIYLVVIKYSNACICNFSRTRCTHQRNLFKTTKDTENLKIRSEKFENDSPIMY